MAGSQIPGPMCQVLKRPDWKDDGTICRCASPLPGPVAPDLSMWDHWTWGDTSNTYLGHERWFEQRYPNLLENARVRFVKDVNTWVELHWGETKYDETTARIKVHGRNKFESSANKNIQWSETFMRDDRFEVCGDQPQSFHEADMVVGSFAIDIVTPIEITYSTAVVNGQSVATFSWTSTMYVEDTMGIQPHDKPAKLGLLGYLPSHKVKRAIWTIGGEGRRVPQESWKKHRVVRGDTLRSLAKQYYGDTEKWPILYKFNVDAIGPEPGKLKIGTMLVIPDPTRLSPGLIQQILANPPVKKPGQPTIRGPELL